jgi:hypothetical protein
VLPGALAFHQYDSGNAPPVTVAFAATYPPRSTVVRLRPNATMAGWGTTSTSKGTVRFVPAASATVTIAR